MLTEQQLVHEPVVGGRLDHEETVEEVYGAYQAKVHNAKEHSTPEPTGVIYQRCGGGRRIIRKKIGGQ